MVPLQYAWEQLLAEFAIDRVRSQSAYTSLVAAYSSPSRIYHTLEHIEDVLHWIEKLHDQAVNLSTIQLAAWFHDSVYDPQANDNEEQSVLYAQQILSSLALSSKSISIVSQMILSTKTHQVTENQSDCQILLDADLAILGTPRLRYDLYTQAIRQEYSWVPELSYRAGRTQVLQSFIQRPRIYLTDQLYTILETQARDNIRREITSLA